jgi:superoxide dismutase, Cu-Zn family
MKQDLLDRILLALGLVLLFAIASGCGRARPTAEGAAGALDEGRAVATLEPKSGSAVTGTATFVQQPDGTVRVVAELQGLTPGQHGFHVHELGDCTAPDASSAGPHFAGRPAPHAPALGTGHGLPAAQARHVGDLGNITAAEDGSARLELVDEIIALEGERSIVGRALVVHERRDDGATVESAGARVACGVIVARPVG